MKYLKVDGIGFGFAESKSDAMRFETALQANRWRNRLMGQSESLGEILHDGASSYLLGFVFGKEQSMQYLQTDGTGFTEDKSGAKRFETASQAESVRDRILDQFKGYSFEVVPDDSSFFLAVLT